MSIVQIAWWARHLGVPAAVAGWAWWVGHAAVYGLAAHLGWPTPPSPLRRQNGR